MELQNSSKPETFKFRKKKNSSTSSFMRYDEMMNRSSSAESFESHELSSSTFDYQTAEKKPFNFSSFLGLKTTYQSMLSPTGSRSSIVDRPSCTEPEKPDQEEDFVLARLEAHSRQQSTKIDKPSSTWFQEIQSSFQTAKKSFLGNEQDDFDQVDWDFWGKVINDYETMIRVHPKQFQRNLRKGLPEPIRGMMWQLMSNSKSEALEEEYLKLLTRSSRHEKIIQRDLSRTFPSHELFKDPQGPGQASLFNILKAYSLYDQEVGYCQGMPFVVGCLLLNMPEEQSFCVLVRLMFDFNFRDLYSPKMIGLQVRNYQFDKLLQEQFPLVFQHLENQDIRSTMYASQWYIHVKLGS
jgi:hypothetical protein